MRSETLTIENGNTLYLCLNGNSITPAESFTDGRAITVNSGGFKGMRMFLLDLEDRADVSEWAYEAMCWMIMNEIINGVAGGDSVKLDPAGGTTRAQVATMLWRFCELIKED